ncbi:C-type lectin 1 isoform X6 [Salmo trutta]|uniref:C-type lectin 1 isoform X6 n=1 Tax=Salmo trutta TaxID=8032 RepID=UPI00113071BC|nr:C-type lectin 1-like isoform X6 [Salmo trutta]XP_029569376.1 C-type lectin 1-like isoform X6 [Salmo trutta]
MADPANTVLVQNTKCSETRLRELQKVNKTSRQLGSAKHTSMELQRQVESLQEQKVALQSRVTEVGIHKLMHTVQFNSKPMHIKGFWIGLKEEEDTEGTWTWLDGTDLTQGYWEDGEPNDHYGMEDFAAIKINPMKFWNDATCTSEMQSKKA